MADAVSRIFSPCGSLPKSIPDHRGSRLFSASSRSRSSSSSSSYSPSSSSSSSSSIKSQFLGRRLVIESQNGIPRSIKLNAVPVEMALTVGKAMRWWAKGVRSNMKEIGSAQDLVDSLSSAGDKLVIVDFFSPGCGGCRSLHPKICQFAENNPDVIFLQANYEEHKSMCYGLNVHVLPFFRFYRGAHGRLCSFSCTIATIKKFKDALAKHNTERCSLGPAKGLEESELLALAAKKDLLFSYSKNQVPTEISPQFVNPMPSISELALSDSVDLALTAVGR